MWAFLVGHEECAFKWTRSYGGEPLPWIAIRNGAWLEILQFDWCLACNSAIRLVPGFNLANFACCLACNFDWSRTAICTSLNSTEFRYALAAIESQITDPASMRYSNRPYKISDQTY